MRIETLKTRISLQEKDYFFLEMDAENYTLMVTDGSGNPVKLEAISRRQLQQLSRQIQNIIFRSDEEKVAKMLAAR